jgi:hypothetical protein
MANKVVKLPVRPVTALAAEGPRYGARGSARTLGGPTVNREESNMYRRAICLLAAAALGGLAQAIPPDSGGDEITAPATIVQDHVRHIRLGQHSAEFETTTLAEIRQWAGAGSQEHDGDAGTFRTWLCYSAPGQLVWFISPEIGGGTQLLEMFGEAVSPDDPRINKCPLLPATLLPISLEFGWVGGSEASIRKILGPPSGAHGEWTQYVYAGKGRGPYQTPGESAPKSIEFDIGAVVEVKYRNGKAVAVRASHVSAT